MTQPCAGVVLVVDDEEDTRESIRDLLEDRGYRVATAEDGEVALEVMRSGEPICLVILDLMMPRLNGLEVLERVALDPSLRELSILVSTSARERVPSGTPCLPKPVDVQRLLTMVEAHCAGAPV